MQIQYNSKHTLEFDDEWIAKFWSRVDQSGGPNACWPWKMSLTGMGYGQVSYHDIMLATHRLAIFFDGRGDPQLFTIHSCDNTKCCNPKHLSMGTPADNTADMMARGRSGAKKNPPVGERSNTAKLKEADVLAIRAELAEGASTKELAAKYAVHTDTILLIRRRKTWRHI